MSLFHNLQNMVGQGFFGLNGLAGLLLTSRPRAAPPPERCWSAAAYPPGPEKNFDGLGSTFERC